MFTIQYCDQQVSSFVSCEELSRQRWGTLFCRNFISSSGEPNSEFLRRTEPNRTFQISKFGRTELTELFGQNFAELFGKPNRTIK